MRRQSEPNITPLIDVLLVLLIIFMAALPLTQQGLDLTVPRDVATPQTPPVSRHIVLEFTADRSLSVNHAPVGRLELAQRLREIFSARTDRTLYLSAAGSLRYGEVVRVIDTAKGAGVERVGVITESMRREK